MKITRVFIIAEAGVNHNGSFKIAERLIKEAKLAGADIIKFQTYKSDKLVIKKSPRFWKWSGEAKKKVLNMTHTVNLMLLIKKNT